MNKTFEMIMKVFSYICDDPAVHKEERTAPVETPIASAQEGSPEYFKNLLLSLYRCKVPFELQLLKTKPKTRMGSYSPNRHIIRINTGWGDTMHSTETAIHEYTHHIHYTEKNKTKRKEDPHGKEFWQIYGQLMLIAKRKGIYNHYDAL